jgi:hypothetical protein
VDRVWDEDIKHSISEPNDSPYKSVSQKNGGTTTDRDSVVPTGSGFWTSNLILITLRYRLWPTMFDFFAAQYVDEKTEKQFEREHWHLRKVGWNSCHRVTDTVVERAAVTRVLVVPVYGDVLGFNSCHAPETIHHHRQDLLFGG